MNTPKALAELFALRASDPASLRGALDLLGIKLPATGNLNATLDETQLAATATTISSDPVISSILDARSKARSARDWKESDRLRDELATLGIVVRDNKDGTTTLERKS